MVTKVPPPPGHDNPPVIVLGGAENAVAAARHFRACGVPCAAVNTRQAAVFRSRGVERCEIDDGGTDAFAQWLHANASARHGAVVLALNDRALAAVARHHDELAHHYRLPPVNPSVVEAMLDKQATLELIQGSEVPAPQQWTTEEDLHAVAQTLPYPVILKPRRNHELLARTGKKYLRADDATEFLDHLLLAEELESGFVVNEFVPGPDSRLSSYYAIRDVDGTTLMEFTKRVDRRYPPNQGGATFHELVWLPATAAAGRRFFDAIGLVGLGNVEFKHDERTDELKLIECNHRLTAATALMQDHGIDVVGATYQHACGRLEAARPDQSASGTMWYPLRDFRSHRVSGVALRRWIRRPWRSSWPYLRWSDPGPAVWQWWRYVREAVRLRIRG